MSQPLSSSLTCLTVKLTVFLSGFGTRDTFITIHYTLKMREVVPFRIQAHEYNWLLLFLTLHGFIIYGHIV